MNKVNICLTLPRVDFGSTAFCDHAIIMLKHRWHNERSVLRH